MSKVIQTNAAGNIAGSLTTVAQEGNFGETDISNRSMLYLYPSVSFPVRKWGDHDFKAGVELYPFLRNRQSRDIAPIEFYYRPPGTTGAADVLFERDTFRSNGTGGGSAVNNYAYEHIYGGYIQDRWKPRSNISIKAGVRIDANAIFTQDRQVVLGNAFPPGFPTVTADQEFSQTTFAPNFGIAYDAARWGVVPRHRRPLLRVARPGRWRRHVARSLCGDDRRAARESADRRAGSQSGAAWRLSTRRQLRPGQQEDLRQRVQRRAGRSSLPRASSFNATFVLKRTWDFQGADDENIVRDPTTGALLGRPFPAFDAVLRTYAPNYSFQQFRSLQFLYTKNFGQRWGMNANYWYGMHQTIQLEPSTRRATRCSSWASRADDADQQLGDAAASGPRLVVRAVAVRIPAVGPLHVHRGAAFGRAHRHVPLNSTAPTIVLSNGRAVSDPFWTGVAANAFPRGGRRGVDMLVADNVHLVNLRIQKSLDLGDKRKIELSADAFNLFNTDAAFGFLSADARSSNFGVKTNFVQPRVGQVGVRFVF